MLSSKRLFKVPLWDWAWLLAFALLRVVVATRNGLGVDEAHYVLYGLYPDWSYFDHPPLTGWIEGLVIHTLGNKEWMVRLPAILSGFIASLFAFRISERLSGKVLVARWVTLALNSMFLPTLLWIMFLPDTLLLVLCLWLVEIVGRLLTRNKPIDWIQLGICLGLCGLSKYTAIFFVLSLVGIVITEKAWGKIRVGWLALASVIALVLILPVVYWNVQHHWISFSYQQNHVMGSQHFHLNYFLTFLATQVLAYSPFVVLAAAIGLWKGRAELETQSKVLLWISLPMLAFFSYTSFKDEMLPHWTLIGWDLLVITGLSIGLSKGYKLKPLILISLSVLLFVMAELTFKFIKFPPYQSPYADLVGWKELHEDIEKGMRGEPQGTYALAVPNWTLGSRARYYLADLGQVFVLDDRFDQFDLWEQGQNKTPNLLVVTLRGFDLSNVELKKCQSTKPVESRTFSINGSPVNSAQLFWCRGYRWD